MTEQLLTWYNEYKRDLPWRKTQDPYYIWVSEIILQQTRVVQGINYYFNFIKSFPTLKSLALSNEDKVMTAWQGLGYYTRAKNLHTTAKFIYYNCNNQFPNNYSGLIKLKGIGPYTAAAIASLAFNEKVPALDGNVYRVLSRLLGINTPIDSTKGKKDFFNAAEQLIDAKDPGTSNQAFIELGALICTPKQPRCHECPVMDNCYAYSHNKTATLPVKGKTTKTRNRYFNFLIIHYKGEIAIHKRIGKDIWNALYQLPLIETSAKTSFEKLAKNKDWVSLFGNANINISKVSKIVKHILSHQIIYGKFIHIHIMDKTFTPQKDWIFIEPQSYIKYAFPVMITKYLSTLDNFHDL